MVVRRRSLDKFSLLISSRFSPEARLISFALKQFNLISQFIFSETTSHKTVMLKIGFCGAGKMAQALAKGFIGAGEAHFDVNAVVVRTSFTLLRILIFLYRTDQGRTDCRELPAQRRRKHKRLPGYSPKSLYNANLLRRMVR